jgi:hypothetical protein
MEKGVPQPDGRRVPESTFDVSHVAAAVVHIASLPPDVAVPHFTIMYVATPFLSASTDSVIGLQKRRLLGGGDCIYVSFYHCLSSQYPLMKYWAHSADVIFPNLFGFFFC